MCEEQCIGLVYGVFGFIRNSKLLIFEACSSMVSARGSLLKITLIPLVTWMGLRICSGGFRVYGSTEVHYVLHVVLWSDTLHRV